MMEEIDMNSGILGAEDGFVYRMTRIATKSNGKESSSNKKKASSEAPQSDDGGERW